VTIEPVRVMGAGVVVKPVVEVGVFIDLYLYLYVYVNKLQIPTM